MTTIGVAADDAPVITLTLAGRGEPLLRMEKRLTCATSGLGLKLALTLHKDPAALGIPYTQTPAVLAEGQIIFSGLPRIKEIEIWLTQFISSRQTP